MIKIICLGKIKEDYLINGINDYAKRIGKYHKIEIIELKDDENMANEESQILKNIDNHSLNIAMCIEGKTYSSIELSKVIESAFIYHPSITFIIGSSNGLTDKVKDLCDIKMSFGNITLPHGLFRLVLLEQIYRCFKIINKESYHK